MIRIAASLNQNSFQVFSTLYINKYSYLLRSELLHFLKRGSPRHIEDKLEHIQNICTISD